MMKKTNYNVKNNKIILRMTSPLIIVIKSTVTALLLLTNSYAQEQTMLVAHIHGSAEITVVIADSQIEIEFTSPAMNLVGFEYEAKNAEDIALVARVESLLNRPETLFSFTESQCEVIEQAIDISSIQNKKTEDHEHDEHKEHNENEDDNPYGKPDKHTEVSARYRYLCEKVSVNPRFSVYLFDLFPSINEIQVMWVNNMQQGAFTLNEDNNVINLG